MTTNNIKEEILGEFRKEFWILTGESSRELYEKQDKCISDALDKYANAKLEEAVGKIKKMNIRYEIVSSGTGKKDGRATPFINKETAISIINNLKTK